LSVGEGSALTEHHQYLHKPPRLSVSFILKLKKATAETLDAAESQPKRKTQRRCGYEGGRPEADHMAVIKILPDTNGLKTIV
jgi:hypothetical protein